MKTRITTCKSFVPALALAMALISGPAAAQQSAAGASYTRPGTDFSTYHSFLIRPLDLSDVKLLKPVWEQDDPEEWAFSGENREAVQQMFMEIMNEELSANDGFPVVDASGTGVLQLEVEILSVTPYVKPGTQSGDGEPEMLMLGSGDVVVSAELRDSVTGQLLILVEGERTIGGGEYRPVSPESHMENIRALFTTWGQRLRARMNAAHAR